MGTPTREELLAGTDVVERDVELPDLGWTVRVRSLPAAYSNEAQYEAIEIVNVMHKGREQRTTRVNSVKLEALKVLHGLIDPKLSSIADANTFSQRYSRAWQTIVKAIDALSGLDDEAVERTNAMFHDGGPVAAGPAVGNGTGTGDGRPAVPVRVGA